MVGERCADDGSFEGGRRQEREGRWLPYRDANADASVRLFLFHWGGSSASAYAQWERLAFASSRDVETCAVQMPGREGFDDLGLTGDGVTLAALAEALVSDLGHLFGPDEPKPVFFGHGTGSWFAFEVARLLESRSVVVDDDNSDESAGDRLLPPVALFVSCFPAPDIPVEDRPWPALSGLASEADLRRHLVQVWGVPIEALRPPARKPFQEALQRDLGLLDAYLCVPPGSSKEAGSSPPSSQEVGGGKGTSVGVTKLKCPISLFVSREDPFVGPMTGSPVLMEAWGRFTQVGKMSVDIFYGDHYYLCDRKMGNDVGRVLLEKVQKIADLVSFEF